VPRFSSRAPTDDPLAAYLVAQVERGWSLDHIERSATGLRDEPELLRASIATLGNDTAALRDVCARSSVHPNGFAKVVLRSGEGWSIRLHIWPPGRDVDDVNPHGHRWVFASWIIAGGLSEIIFDESPKGELFVRCDYRRDRESAYLRPVGTATLTPVRTIDRPAGTVYTRGRSVLHTAKPRNRELVASLVLQGRSFDSTPVYLRPGIPAVHEEQALRPDELRSLLDLVSAEIR
jgi:hypothetical protein